jgi:hypothetical protein
VLTTGSGLAMVKLSNLALYFDTLFLGFFDSYQKFLARSVFFIIMNTAWCDIRRLRLADHDAGGLKVRIGSGKPCPSVPSKIFS